MFKKILSIALIMTAFNSFGKEPEAFRLWENQPPMVENGLTPSDEIVENPGWTSNVATGELFVYPAERPNGMALLMCPGGGYSGVAMEHEGRALAKPLNDLGITVGVVKYRMPNGHWQVPTEDVNRAYEIMVENADGWGINPNKIGIGGASAGGHLASTIATHPENKFKPAFQILLYPVISMNQEITHGGSRHFLLGDNPSPALVEYYSNERQVNSQTPPAFIAVSADDTVVPVKNSIDYFNALTANGVPVSLHVYPTGNHGWGYKPEKGENQMWFFELVNWLNNLYPQK